VQHAAGVLDLARRVERGQIVGAMSISSGGCSNGFTPGPAATITPSFALSGEVSPSRTSSTVERKAISATVTAFTSRPIASASSWRACARSTAR
jgi:hypothetical protein